MALSNFTGHTRIRNDIQGREMQEIHYIRETLGMTAKEFMSEWRDLSLADKVWYQEAVKAERKFMERKVKVFE